MGQLFNSLFAKIVPWYYNPRYFTITWLETAV